MECVRCGGVCEGVECGKVYSVREGVVWEDVTECGRMWSVGGV